MWQEDVDAQLDLPVPRRTRQFVRRCRAVAADGCDRDVASRTSLVLCGGSPGEIMSSGQPHRTSWREFRQWHGTTPFASYRATLRVHLRQAGQRVRVHPKKPPGQRSTNPEDLPKGTEVYTTRDLETLKAMAAKEGPAIGAYAVELRDTPPPSATSPTAAGSACTSNGPTASTNGSRRAGSTGPMTKRCASSSASI
jgi:hypothetical protein